MPTIETFPVESMRINIEMHMDASPEQVYAALTTGVEVWWDAGHLESKKLARHLILEPRLGGRFYEVWDDVATDRDGAMLGMVIQIRKWQILKLSGYFGLEEHAALGVVTFKLFLESTGTKLVFSHDAVGELNDAIRQHTARSWTDLLQALKAQVEHNRSSGLRSDPSFD